MLILEIETAFGGFAGPFESPFVGHNIFSRVADKCKETTLCSWMRPGNVDIRVRSQQRPIQCPASSMLSSVYHGVQRPASSV